MTVEGVWSVILVLLLAVLVPVLVMALVGRLGLKVARRDDTEDKLSVFECGREPGVDARRRFPAKFYLVAVLFVLFDIEVVFLIPWAVTFRELGAPGALGWWILVAMLVFLEILVVGLVYVIKRGALEWE